MGQLAKASRLPLDLATEGKLAFSGRVAVLPPGVGISHSAGNFEFTRGEDLSSLVSALPPADSMVLLLSGAAPSVVSATLALKASGARVLATLLSALEGAGKKRGLASLCIGGGEATAMAVELV